MADWTDVLDTNLEPGKPIRSVDIIAIKDNTIAMGQGATGAQRMTLLAIEELTAGSTIRSRKDTEVSTSGAELLQHTFAFFQRGTIRVTAKHKASSLAVSVLYFKRRRNRTTATVASWSTTSTSYITRTYDVSVLPGDTITISHQQTAAGSEFYLSYCKEARFQTNGENLWPGAGAALENTF